MAILPLNRKRRNPIMLWCIDRRRRVLHHDDMKTWLMISAIMLTACASVSTRLPDISLTEMKAEQIQQEELAFTELGRMKNRLTNVAIPILASNTPLCPKTRNDIGVRTHKLSSYPKSIRAAARRELGARDKPSIIFIRPDSPAQRAGFLRGDEILNADGEPISVFDRRFQALLEINRTLQIRRNNDILSLDIEPERICNYRVRLSMSTDVNAYADGQKITITSGMMNFVQSDDELALIIGHELAHNTMGHIRKIVTNVILSALSTRYTRPFESEADYVGMYYLVRAGFSPDGVEDVWRRLGTINPRSVARAKSHPTYPDRYLRIAATRSEIEDKQAANLPLIPNFLSSEDSKS